MNILVDENFEACKRARIVETWRSNCTNNFCDSLYNDRLARTLQSETKKREKKKKREEGAGYKVGCNFESI